MEKEPQEKEPVEKDKGSFLSEEALEDDLELDEEVENLPI